MDKELPKHKCDRCGKEKTLDKIEIIRSKEGEQCNPFMDLEIICGDCATEEDFGDA